MSTPLSRHQPRLRVATRKASARLGRLATVLGAVIAGLLASAAAAATAAFAQPIPVGDCGTTPLAPVPPTIARVITTGGMPGWQITVIAVGAALAAAAVLLDRKLAGRAALPPPPPDAPTRHRTLRPPDDRPGLTGLKRQTGPGGASVPHGQRHACGAPRSVSSKVTKILI